MNPSTLDMGVSKIGHYVRTRRLALGLTQEQLEEISGLKQNYISLVERGKVARPRDDALESLARGLEVSVDDLKIAMGYVVRVEGDAKLTAETDTSAIAETSPPYTAQPPPDPRQRLFLKKTTEKPMTDAQWEKLLAILDEEDESEG